MSNLFERIDKKLNVINMYEWPDGIWRIMPFEEMVLVDPYSEEKNSIRASLLGMDILKDEHKFFLLKY